VIGRFHFPICHPRQIAYTCGMENQPPVALALDRLHVPYRLFVHPGSVHSLEQAARERGHLPDQVIRSIVFRVGKDEFVMVLIAGERQIAWPLLRRHLGQSRLTMATEAEVKAATGYERGAVAPFGLPRPMRILVDESVFVHAEISLGSGVRGTAVILQSADLRRALGDVEVGSFGESA
jgi:Cys-tRNA(Pro) deacylase